MSKMYFDVNPDAAHDIHDLAVVLLGQKMNFYTDAGVFSKKMIDYGSQVLLSTLDFQEGESVLDVGCGYGPIGLSLAKVQGVTVTMVDVNERALDLAKKNANRNGVEAQIFSSDVYEAVVGDFDHVISNPPIRAGKKVVHQVITGSFEHLKPGGDLSLALNKEEIEWLIEGYVAGTVPDYQMSAFAMAVYFKGMTTEEISHMTMKMVQTGQQFDLSAIPGIKVDKHSTGGVGDKVTLVLVPLVASFGVPVAKMSGRGLGHTGGTIDKLESIKGFQIERTQEEFIQQVQETGLSVIGQSDQLVKADKLLYALRDVTATVDTIPLIASSVMSKKIAAGADAILLDVTVGEGAFMKNIEDARRLARTMVDLGNAVGRKTIAVITDMSQPLGTSIGNRLEILEALDILKGQGRADVTEFICELAQIMLKLTNVDQTIEAIHEHLSNGQALAKFEEMVVAQGGDLEDLHRPVKVDQVLEVTADHDGVIAALPAMEFGLFAMRLGAGRAVKSDPLDYETGIVFDKKVGEHVKKGERIARIFMNEKNSQESVTEFKKNVKILERAESVKEIIEIIS